MTMKKCRVRISSSDRKGRESEKGKEGIVRAYLSQQKFRYLSQLQMDTLR